MQTIRENILKTLLYYDIFDHPLTPDEVFTFLPENSVTKVDIQKFLRSSCSEDSILTCEDGYYFIKPGKDFVKKRLDKEKYSKKMWRAASAVTHIIKRFPFVRAVLVTGSLSKNSSVPDSDLDFMVITEPNRLWITRTLLMLFKKIFLLNSYKYFCINYFISKDRLEIEEKNVYTATEIGHIKATYNESMMNEFISANLWIKDFFPNYSGNANGLHSSGNKVNNRISYMQRVTELFYFGKLGDRLDSWLLKLTFSHWQKKYRHVDENERMLMFKSTTSVSKAHPGNMQKQILTLYKDRLQKFRLN